MFDDSEKAERGVTLGSGLKLSMFMLGRTANAS
jgi:hypothetical protein